MADNSAIETAAASIRQAYSSGITCAPVRDLLPALDIASAYAVQNVNTKIWMEQGRRLVGFKTGLTSRSVQTQLGVDQPDFGRLFADMAVVDGDEVVVDAVLQPKVEAEVALVLSRDINQEQPTMAELISSIAYALPSIEIVGSRIKDWNINIVDTIADNASSGLFVLGNEPKKLDGLDLRLCGMVMECRGEQVSTGAGLACLGHPLNAALWLAKTMISHGSPLQAGDIILTGALGPMVAASPGDVIEARISGLGSVRAAFGG
ncbi:2-keto-4-pentenoate hydratase [Oceanicoccus sp. KOV_DT_Chl]|uniref:2-keto-4-pentenoate hydratase n=1 Tax=Oceanicoccus sp. KOV_DT_Chl TaxID=1904639 RepID=UPI000C7B339C|nr:fumarylacetoacetate hydrolase family protein [Oceanicoccus sp. KOV_DT_Chl]